MCVCVCVCVLNEKARIRTQIQTSALHSADAQAWLTAGLSGLGLPGAELIDIRGPWPMEYWVFEGKSRVFPRKGSHQRGFLWVVRLDDHISDSTFNSSSEIHKSCSHCHVTGCPDPWKKTGSVPSSYHSIWSCACRCYGKVPLWIVSDWTSH
jgi:hypothetical protein